MKWGNLAKFLLSFILASAILIGAGFAILQYLVGRFADLPPRPTFPEEQQSKIQPTPKPILSPSPQFSPIDPTPNPTATESPEQAVETPTPSPSPTDSPTDGEPGKISWPDGVILRDGPNADAGRVGGIEYNQPVVVLETSPDGQWQRVRVAGSDQEGWVKAGNVQAGN